MCKSYVPVYWKSNTEKREREREREKERKRGKESSGKSWIVFVRQISTRKGIWEREREREREFKECLCVRRRGSLYHLRGCIASCPVERVRLFAPFHRKSHADDFASRALNECRLAGRTGNRGSHRGWWCCAEQSGSRLLHVGHQSVRCKNTFCSADRRTQSWSGSPIRLWTFQSLSCSQSSRVGGPIG